MVTTLHSIQIISGLALIALILLQRPSNDAGSMPIGGESASFAHTRRGAEAFFFKMTIATAIIFAGVSLAIVILTK